MEILPSDPPLAEPSKAADGGHVPGACNTLGDFVRSLEDGQFDADAYAAIKRLSAALTATAMSNGGKAKGKVTISLDFEQEGSVTQIKAAFKEIGRASCRERGCQYVEIAGVGVSLKKKKK